MKLYGNIKSERAEKGQGGNEFLVVEITDNMRQRVATINVFPGSKAKVTVEVNEDLAELTINTRDSSCTCIDPLCAKCLLVNCGDAQCSVHPEHKKKEFREMYKNR
jgi:hypothetical protein